jgi:hypothetical protein
MRQVARVDTNQTQIVAAARKLGAGVLHLHQVGQGCPDLLLGKGVNLLIEVKMPGADLTPQESQFHLWWPGQVAVVRSVEELVEVINGRW